MTIEDLPRVSALELSKNALAETLSLCLYNASVLFLYVHPTPSPISRITLKNCGLAASMLQQGDCPFELCLTLTMKRPISAAILQRSQPLLHELSDLCNVPCMKVSFLSATTAPDGHPRPRVHAVCSADRPLHEGSLHSTVSNFFNMIIVR